MEFHGAFYTPDSGQISIALEYMDGGSLADVIRVQKCIPEPVLSSMFQKLLHVRIAFLVCAVFSLTFITYFFSSLYKVCAFLQGIKLLAWGSTFSSQGHKTSKFAHKSQGGAKDNRFWY